MKTDFLFNNLTELKYGECIHNRNIVTCDLCMGRAETPPLGINIEFLLSNQPKHINCRNKTANKYKPLKTKRMNPNNGQVDAAFRKINQELEPAVRAKYIADRKKAEDRIRKNPVFKTYAKALEGLNKTFYPKREPHKELNEIVRELAEQQLDSAGRSEIRLPEAIREGIKDDIRIMAADCTNFGEVVDVVKLGVTKQLKDGGHI